jgi:ribosomal protein S18 acetylase RimI-like enzyme
MITTVDIIDELLDVYYKNEYWHQNKMPEEEARKYHKKLLEQGNIIPYVDNGNLLGYVEFWRINFEQFGKIICKVPFSAYLQNVTDGNIAYLANVWINPEFRHSGVIKALKMKFFAANYKCEYFVGEALRKRTQPVKVFKRRDILKQGVRDG